MSFVVDEAASGRRASHVRQAAEAGQPYEIVLIDWQMPGMDGIETGKRILCLPDLKHSAALVMVTAYGREEVLKQAADSGFETVLIKPVTPSILFDTAVGAPRRRASRARPRARGRTAVDVERACAAPASSWSRTTS